jgi:hypothetical protein
MYAKDSIKPCSENSLMWYTQHEILLCRTFSNLPMLFKGLGNCLQMCVFLRQLHTCTNSKMGKLMECPLAEPIFMKSSNYHSRTVWTTRNSNDTFSYFPNKVVNQERGENWVDMMSEGKFLHTEVHFCLTCYHWQILDSRLAYTGRKAKWQVRLSGNGG